MVVPTRGRSAYICCVSVVATQPYCVVKFCENLIVRRVSITLFFSYVRHHAMPVQMYQKFWCCGCGGALFSPQISCQYPSVIPHFPSTCREGRRHPPRAHCRRPSPLRAMRPYARRDSIPPHSPRGSTLPAWHQTPPGKHKAQARQSPVTMKHRQNKGYATWHLRAIRHHILSDVPFMESSHNVNKFIRESLQHFLLDVWRHLSVECLCYPASYRPHRVSVAVQ